MKIEVWKRRNTECHKTWLALLKLKQNVSRVSSPLECHVDSRYKFHFNLRTMLDHAKRLSSTPEFLSQQSKNLKGIFFKLKYPEKLINSAIYHPPDLIHAPSNSSIWMIIPIIMPCKDQKFADVVRKQLRNLWRKIDHE